MHSFSPLNMAIIRGEEDTAKRLIEMSASFESEDQSFTPLMWATWHNHPKIIKELVRHKANIDHINLSGDTALSIAIRNGDMNVVKVLLECKATINQGREPDLHMAAIHDRKEIAMLLLKEYKVDINQKAQENNTVLMNAAYCGSLNVIRSLLEFEDIDIFCKNKNGETARDIAAKQGQMQAVKILEIAEAVKISDEAMTAKEHKNHPDLESQDSKPVSKKRKKLHTSEPNYFTAEQEQMIDAVAEKYSLGYFWKHARSFSYLDQWVALIDIYAGQFPNIFKRNETLFLEYTHKLIQHCKDNNLRLPNIWKATNPALKEYSDALEMKATINKQVEEVKNSIKMPETKKIHLQQIQKVFSQPILKDRFESRFTRDEGIYLYSNDSQRISDYFEVTDLSKKPKISSENKSFNLLNGLYPKPKQNTAGIILGNGFVLSLLPEIPADDILLLDVEPVVHYFLMQVRNLILQSDTNKDFNTLKKEIIAAIAKLESNIYEHNWHEMVDIDIHSEMHTLGDKHFLSSESRFNKCKMALQQKELLPIKVDIFSDQQMKALGSILNQNSCKVSYMNLTNVADYDEYHVLRSRLKHIPLTSGCKIISTSLISYPSKGPSRKAFQSVGLEELSQALDFNYYKNTPRHSYSYGW